MNQRYGNIEGLVGPDPVGAVLTIGTKSASGTPTDRNMFYIKSVFAQDVNGTLRKEPHPAFASFNTAAAEKRRVIKGHLVHHRKEDCFEASLAAQKLKDFPSHPRKIPTCCGNGIEATRFYGKRDDGRDDFRTLPCPHSLCIYRQGKTPSCKPAVRFLFRISWAEGVTLPRILVRFVSHSWNTAKMFEGFFSYLAAQAHGFGLSDYSLFGVPFSLTLVEKTSPEDKSRFPVVTISPEADMQEFFGWQRRQLESFGGKLALPAPLSAPENSAPEIIAADFADIVPGLPVSKPANAPEIIDAEPVDATLATLSFEALARIRSAAHGKGIDGAALDKMLGAPLEDAPAGMELEVLRLISIHKAAK